MNPSSIISLLLMAILVGAVLPARALQPDEILANAALEQRARNLSQMLRCPLCDGEDLDTSNADIARDIRLKIRRMLIDGKSDEEIINWAVARYGNAILMRPPLQPSTIPLWFGPVIILIGLIIVASMTMRRKDPAS